MCDNTNQVDAAILNDIGMAEARVSEAIGGSKVTGDAIKTGKFTIAHLNLMGAPTAAQRNTFKLAYQWTDEEYEAKERAFLKTHTEYDTSLPGYGGPNTRKKKGSKDATKEILAALKRTTIRIRSPVAVAAQRSHHSTRELIAVCLVDNNHATPRDSRVLKEDVANLQFGNELQSKSRPPSTQEKRRPPAINGSLGSRKRTRRSVNPN